MANERWPVYSGTSEVIPTTNGTYQTNDMSTSQGNNCYVYVEFFSDAQGLSPVTPTAGTLTFSGTPMGNVYLSPSSSSSINATSVAYPSGTYTPPSFIGRMVQGRVVLNGISGANYARIIFWRY